MQSFLDQVADFVLDNYHDRLSGVAVITPNRRAGLFLKKHFAAKVSTSTWAADIMSMEDFITRLTGITIQEPIALMLDFYSVYQGLEQQKADSLEEFIKWAPMLIKDFNDIDAHLSDPRQLFLNLTDVKRMEAWNPEGTPPTEFQLKYLSFFKNFPTWHQAFTEAILKKQTAYQGLAYRQAAHLISGADTPVLPWDHLVFTGFNALNQAEETIIYSLVKKGMASVLWDADKYYLDNRNHEAGFFLRKYRKSWSSANFTFTGDHFSLARKVINIYGVPRNVNQAKLAGEILSAMPQNEIAAHNTAVVLANEDLLLPMLNSMPLNIGKINITMGLPIRKTNIYGLYDALFQLHLTTLRMKTSREGSKTAFYFKDIVRLFRHPVLSLLLHQNNTAQSPDNFINSLYKSRKTFLYFDTLASIWGDERYFRERFRIFFDESSTQPGQMILSLLHLGEELDASFRSAAREEGVDMEQTSWFTDFEALYSINIILRKLQQFLQDHPIDFRTLFMLFQAMSRESKLTLSGEPLEGLQVMGMLETRNLDFKNLVLLSANEDILPQSKSNSSFIPYDVKAFFGLPVYKEKDAVYSYHFYRLLQRAEHIHIIYNTQSQDLGSSEKSRYITQLQMELPPWNPNISITEKIISLPPALQAFNHEIRVEKTDEIFNRLDIINDKGFSPSTLIQYIKCPLLFYFRHIVGIEETVIPEETIQANTLGTVIHEVMEHLYEQENLEGKQITPGHIDNMLKSVDTVTAEKFAEVYKGGDISSGKNLLLSRVSARYVKNYLEHEKELLIVLAEKNSSLTYIKAEEQLSVTLPFGNHKPGYSIKFRGFADRIDQLGEYIRIIDYKTGKAEKEELKFSEWSELFSSAEKGKSFQLMMYAMLYNRTYRQPAPLCPGIIAFRNLSAGVLTLSGPWGTAPGIIDQTAIDDFEQHLLLLMQEIFNPEIPFEATTEEKTCTHCDFKIVCNRYTSS